MIQKAITRYLILLLPLLLSGFICLVLILFLVEKAAEFPSIISEIKDYTSLFIGIGALFSAIILLILAGAGIYSKKSSQNSSLPIFKPVQQMHNLRAIVEILVNSNMWLPGIKQYIDVEYAGMSFFDVKEFYKGKSKLAINFLQDNNKYGETENLYLELKSLLFTNTKEKKIPELVLYPSVYSKEIIAKWIEHKTASGLWYFFGYKYGQFKDALDIESLPNKVQDRIMKLAQDIDKEVFEDSSLNDVFFAKLGEYANAKILPKLYNVEIIKKAGTPMLINYLYIIFSVFMVFGIILPVLFLLLQFSVVIVIICFAVIISLLFFVVTTFYQVLIREF